jgi:hypothetical protein
MLFLGIATIPGKSIGDFFKKSVETIATNPYPDFIKRTYMFGVDLKPEGGMCHILYDIEKGKEDEGLADISRRISIFAMSVEGFKMTLTPVVSLEQAFDSAGKLGLI